MLSEKPTLVKTNCFHCGEEVKTDAYKVFEKEFCCIGCQTVYQILEENQLTDYYNYNDTPGKTQQWFKENYGYLDVDDISSKLVDYRDELSTVVTLYVPAIHCSSCIWLLENLQQMQPAILRSRIDFLKKEVCISFKNNNTSLRSVVELMVSIGYEPMINLQDIVKEKKADVSERTLIKKIAVAGFCFGNVMLLSFPDYFGMAAFEQEFKEFFGWLNLAFAIPAVTYCGRDYFRSAWVNLKAGRLNLDFPLALGIAVMFIRSAYEIVFQTGAGFIDTLCGLIFFLLVGKWMQQLTFHHISFERDYRSYFPVAVTTINNDREQAIPLADLKTGDRILVRSMEIIPADAILLKGSAEIDFSFVTGESIPVIKTLGEVVYAGGRQLGSAVELEVIKSVSQSYLTQLWNNEAFHKPKNNIKTFSDTASKYFSIILLIVAFGTAGFWISQDEINKAIATFTAVLIIACPCALALSSPFTLAAVISIFDKNKLYLKNTSVVEELAKIDTIVFDKTGTITSPEASGLTFIGKLSAEQTQIICDLARNSSHPLSRELTRHLNRSPVYNVYGYQEKIGRGISGMVGDNSVKLGSSAFLELSLINIPKSSSIHVMINGKYLGYYVVKQLWRTGFKEVVLNIEKSANLHLLSGDQDYDRGRLISFFADNKRLHFGQSPQDKLNYIEKLQVKRHKVLMFGDGLNDSGALKQSDLGIAVTDNINNFSPGCDAVLDGSSFQMIPQFINQAKDALKIIHMSFGISLTYNAVGLFFAVQGLLSPLIAAVLMPISTITIILFTTITARIFAFKNHLL